MFNARAGNLLVCCLSNGGGVPRPAQVPFPSTSSCVNCFVYASIFDLPRPSTHTPLQIQRATHSKMAISVRNTVDRLDRPSAYYISKVLSLLAFDLRQTKLIELQCVEQTTQVQPGRGASNRRSTGSIAKCDHPLRRQPVRYPCLRICHLELQLTFG